MTSKVVNVLRAGFALAAFGLGLQTFMPVLGAELDGFAINTQDKAVTVTLFTDQRANYTTEHHGKQFTIVLPQTQLSKEQLENGLPVVIDNKNRFIGRAVPTDDGKVKIILPNLPAEDYAVSIQQKRRGQSAATTKPIESLKPRPAVKAEPESHFEQVASNFPKPVAKPGQSANHLRLSPAPQKANRGQVWNPYVYRPTDFQPVASKTVTRPVAKKAPRIAVNTQDEPVSTVSVAESVQQAFGDQNISPQPASTGNASDPLWYLHSLPPSNAAQATGDTLQGPAAQLLPFGQTPANPVQVTEKPAPSEIKELTAEIRKGFQSLPRWLVITVAVFLGGMGLFSLIGGLVLLKILFNQSRLSLGNNAPPNGLPYSVVPTHTAPDTVKANNANQPDKSSYASRPAYGPTSLQFEDKASIQALDYLKNNASSVTQAVYNSSLVKFPTSSKQRSISRKKASLL